MAQPLDPPCRAIGYSYTYRTYAQGIALYPPPQSCPIAAKERRWQGVSQLKLPSGGYRAKRALTGAVHTIFPLLNDHDPGENLRWAEEQIEMLFPSTAHTGIRSLLVHHSLARQHSPQKHFFKVLAGKFAQQKEAPNCLIFL